MFNTSVVKCFGFRMASKIWKSDFLIGPSITKWECQKDIFTVPKYYVLLLWRHHIFAAVIFDAAAFWFWKFWHYHFNIFGALVLAIGPSPVLESKNRTSEHRTFNNWTTCYFFRWFRISGISIWSPTVNRNGLKPHSKYKYSSIQVMALALLTV